MSSCVINVVDLVTYSKEVEHALRNRQPVVALESTIITHGIPYPDNLRCKVNGHEFCIIIANQRC